MKTISVILAIFAFSSYLPAQSESSQQPAPSQQQPPQPQPQPGPPAESSRPVSSGSTQSTPPTASANSTEAAQANDLLRKIYNAVYRVSDLLSLVQSEKWKMSDSDRKFFDETVESLRASLGTLEESRRQFSGQPQNLNLGDKLDAALRSVLPNVDALAHTVSQYEGPSQASQYTQAHDQLSGLEQSLETYLDSLHPSRPVTQGQPPSRETAGPAPETEKITPPPAPPPPATTVLEVGHMTPEQVKALLHRIYVASFRLNDLLAQVQPGRWRVPQPVRDHFNLSVARFQADLKALEARRSEFSEQTEDPYLGYKTYEAISPVIADLEPVDRDITQFEGRALIAQLDQPVQWLNDSRQALQTYLDFMVRNRNQVVRTYEANLATCQNTLNYAMRSQTVPARPMEPVRFVRPLQSARIRRKEAEEAAHAAEHGGGANQKEAGGESAKSAPARHSRKRKAQQASK
jgi:hypothetical protein